ncbi:MAG: hypothetical protein ACK53L_25615, partial [Pirellulaceae bacterium]
VLAGGVFQNRVLHACLQRQWSPTASARVGWCMRIPTNDGGLAAGQLAITLARQSQAEAVVAFPTPEVHHVSPCAEASPDALSNGWNESRSLLGPGSNSMELLATCIW